MEWDRQFYKGKRVLVTGHTGFKGAWLCKLLARLGAEVTGYALEPPTDPALFTLADIRRDVHSVLGDIRDYEALRRTFAQARPEVVLHLAAQPLVRESYRRPVYTYETNVMGTVHVLECIRQSDTVRSFLNVTTDKVYLNKERASGYRETEKLDGYDPYSNSKSCSELVTNAYKNSFFAAGQVAVSTARAGNVIGGGDFAADRVMPDCVRAAQTGEPLVVRHPHSVRPYQHVLDSLYAYLMIAAKQQEDGRYAGSYNIGPVDGAGCSTGRLVELFAEKWGTGMSWVKGEDSGPHEAHLLRLDCSKLQAVFGWSPRWRVETAVDRVVEWSRCWLQGGDVRVCMEQQMEAFLSQSEGEG